MCFNTFYKKRFLILDSIPLEDTNEAEKNVAKKPTEFQGSQLVSLGKYCAKVDFGLLMAPLKLAQVQSKYFSSWAYVKEMLKMVNVFNSGKCQGSVSANFQNSMVIHCIRDGT